MRKDELQDKIKQLVGGILDRTPIELTLKQSVLIINICSQVVQELADDIKLYQETEQGDARAELQEIKNKWKEINKILQ